MARTIGSKNKPKPAEEGVFEYTLEQRLKMGSIFGVGGHDIEYGLVADRLHSFAHCHLASRNATATHPKNSASVAKAWR